MPLANSTALTVLLTGTDKVYAYEGNWTEAVQQNTIQQTSLSQSNGLREIILAKKKWLGTQPGKNENDLMILIKLTRDVPYKQLIDVLDETTINDIRKFAILKIENEEIDWLAQQD